MSKHKMMTQAQRDHHANQMNLNNRAHQAALDNHANQMNPNNTLYQTGSDAGKK